MPKIPFKTNRPFIIINQMAGKRLLTLQGKNFVVQSRNHSPEQLFRYDESSRTIRSFVNQQNSVAIEHHGRSRNVISKKTDGAWYQSFHTDGNLLINERGLVLDVAGAKDRDGQNVIVWKKHGKLNQQWKIEYVDADTIQNGLIPDKPFKILSKMPGGRAITRSKNNGTIRDARKGDNNQIFVFDSQTGSIQPKQDDKSAMDIGEEGRNRYV